MFTKATGVNKKLKVLVYGPSGAGKTHFALSFPRPAVIDTEGGTELFGGRFDFDVLRTKDFDEVLQAVESITPNKYDTVIVDPVTVLWQVLLEAGQVAAENRALKYRRKPEDATLTPRDWGIIKRKVNALYTRLVNMPTHVVVCGRIKDVNETRGNEVVKVGERVDAEKSTEYLFDIIIKLTMEKGQRVGIIEKDRSGKMQGQRITDPSFESFAEILKVVTSGKTIATAQDQTVVAEKMAADFDDDALDRDIAHAGAVNAANHAPFESPAAAIAWAVSTGAFGEGSGAGPHARNAYNKLKVERKPASAGEMAGLWRADIAARLEALEAELTAGAEAELAEAKE